MYLIYPGKVIRQMGYLRMDEGLLEDADDLLQEALEISDTCSKIPTKATIHYYFGILRYKIHENVVGVLHELCIIMLLSTLLNMTEKKKKKENQYFHHFSKHAVFKDIYRMCRSSICAVGKPLAGKPGS